MQSIAPSTYAALTEIIETVSGVSSYDLNLETDLLDLGLDSLMFVRIGRTIERQYKVSISMKRFYDELSNIGSLTEYLERNGSLQSEDLHRESGSRELDIESSKKNPNSDMPEDFAQHSINIASDQTRPTEGSGNGNYQRQESSALRWQHSADTNTVMSAHMALMRRYLSNLGDAQDQNTEVLSRVESKKPEEVVEHKKKFQNKIESDSSLEMRTKFSGIELNSQSLSATQKDFIQQLSSRLSERCHTSKSMAEAGKEYLADWKYSLQFKKDLKELRFPIVCHTASGSHFTDVDGNEYLDITMGMGVHYFGHSPAFIRDAVNQQLEKNVVLGPQSALAAEVARKICEMTGHDRAALFVTGSDAVMLAMRLVRAARARSKIAVFSGAYHGICSDVLAAQGEDGPVILSPGLSTSSVNDLVMMDYDSADSLSQISSMADELAAVLVEPVQSRNPAIQPQRFLRQLRAICTEKNIPLIFDEMVNGFRQAPGGMQDWFGVKADLSTYGKIIGGGYPLSVIAGSEVLMQWIDGGVWNYGDDSAPMPDSISTGGTHNKHPVALAAANAVLDHINSNPQLFSRARTIMHNLANRINIYFETNAVPLRLNYFGTQFKFENFTTSFEYELFFNLLTEKGIYSWELHVANLSTAHTEEDSAWLIGAIRYAVEAMRSGGFGFRAEKLRRAYYPMSSVQKRLYAVTQRDGAEKPYHLAGAWRLTGSIDFAKLEDSIHQVICRHESLRTSFLIDDGEFYQKIIPEPRFFLDRIDTTNKSVEFLLDNYIAPFDLLEPPLLRVGIGKLDDYSQLLLIDVHHLAADGLSMNIVFQEILALYDGKQLDAVRTQARHVHSLVDEYLVSDAAQNDSDYWLAKIMPILPDQRSFDLSADFLRPLVNNFEGKRLELKFDRDLTESLHNFAKHSRNSTFGVLLGVFSAWIYRYARQSKFLIGLPSAGRPDSAADNSVGMFVNTLVYPVTISDQLTVAEFLTLIRDELFEAQEHSDYPFSSLLDSLSEDFPSNRNPLFDVMFSYENAGSREITTSTFKGETLSQYEGAGMFDLAFDLIETEGEILVNCAFAESLFSHSTMENRLSEFVEMVKELVAGSKTDFLSWALLESHSNELIVSNGCGAKDLIDPQVFADSNFSQPAQAAMTVVELWRQSVLNNGNQIALKDGSSQLSFDSVDDLVVRTTFTLFNLYGVRAGDRVIVSLDSSVQLVVTMLALFSMGAVYVPVTPQTPIKRVKVIAKICNASYFVSTGGNALEGDDVAQGIECVDIESIFNEPNQGIRHQQQVPPEPNDSAYIIFTSGSTGEPKGVEIAHAGIANAVLWRQTTYEMEKADVTLQMPSFAFDASILDVLSTLVSGAQLVIIGREDKRSIKQITDLISKHGVTNLLLTPTLYRVFLEESPSTVGILRFVTLAGEKLPLDLADLHFKLAPSVELWNEYGPTECSVVIIGGKVTPGQDRVTIGRPVSNVGIHVLDDESRLVPTGVWGNLWATGVCLASGYVGRQDLTDQKFVRLPILKNMRAYNTGDIVRELDNGEFEYRGRADNQVKVNGHRVELEEIEIAIRRQLNFSEVAVNVISKGASSGIHAWVVAKNLDKELPKNWRSILAEVLPNWMLPASIGNISKLPLLVSGKLDRSKLPSEPPRTLPVVSDVFSQNNVAFKQSNELKALISHCQVILKRSLISPQDNYFELGGDSIQAIVLASKLYQEGYSLDINDIFRYPVFIALAQRISGNSVSKPKLALSTEILPTPMQCWFYEKCTESKNDFTQSAWLTLPIEMTVSELDKLVRHWVLLHPVFSDVLKLNKSREDKNTFRERGLDKLENCLVLGANSDELENQIQQCYQKIDLDSGPLMKVLFAKDGGKNKALIIFHHFVVDAVSWQIMQSQWIDIWNDIKSGSPLRQINEKCSMGQFVTALHSAESKDRAIAEKQFWLSLPTQTQSGLTKRKTRSSGSNDGLARVEVKIQLPVQSAEVLLRSAHRHYQTRGSELLLAVFVQSLMDVLKTEKIALIMESNGRSQRYADGDFSSTVGWMTSAYPVGFDYSAVKKNSGWMPRIEQIREVTQRVPEQGVGYGVLRYIVKDKEILDLSLPEIGFNHLGSFDGDAESEFSILKDALTKDNVDNLGLLPVIEFVSFADDDGLQVSLSCCNQHISKNKAKVLLDTFSEKAIDLINEFNERELKASSEGMPGLVKSPVDFLDSNWNFQDYNTLLDNNNLLRAEVDDIAPLTPMQQGLVFHSRNCPDDIAYLEQVDFKLKGVNAKGIKKAFMSLLIQYPALRASFKVGASGRTAQIIRKSVRLPVSIHDISGLSLDEQAEAVLKARTLDQKVQFDIAESPLMRVSLFTLREEKEGQQGEVHVIWSHHHLIMDGWCVSILYDRLIENYKSGNSNAAPCEQQLQVRDEYFTWLQQRDFVETKTFWSNKLSGIEGPTRLLPWPKRQETNTSEFILQTHLLEIPKGLTCSLQSWSSSQNSTLSSVIRLVWGVLLARFSDTNDVTFGTIVSGRPPEVAGIEQAVGLFINSIPFRLEIDSSHTGNSGLALVQDQANETRAHDYLSLAEIQDAAPDLKSREPLFDHLLVFENYPMDESLRSPIGEEAGYKGTDITITDISAFERTDLPLNIIVVPIGDRLEVSFLYNEAVYSRAQIEHLSEHFIHLLQEIDKDPRQPLLAIDLLTKTEKSWLTNQWNSRNADFPQKSIYGIYADTAKQFGCRTALIDSTGELSHSEFHKNIQRAASGLLASENFRPGQRVALWLPRNREMVTAMLAVLAAGGTYIALDPIYPKERIDFILEDSNAVLIITSEDMPEFEFGTARVRLDTLLEFEECILPTVDQETAAYVIYTSGSTGSPKGCEISHQNVVRLLKNNQFDFDFGESDVWIAAHSFCFDFSVWEMYGAFLNGGSLIIPTTEQVRDVESFVSLVAGKSVSVLNQTPHAFYQFAQIATKMPNIDLSALRLVVFGGDTLQTNRLKQWIDVYPLSEVKLVNMYGITETTVHVSYYEVQAEDITDFSTLNKVGRPLPETEVWIVDCHGNLLPPGVIGEIVVGGSGVGLGYINREHLTAKKFSRLNTNNNSKCYWTGDVGLIDLEHGLIFLGRNDQQVQVRGYRVECEEVALQYETHQSVDQALVLSIENTHGTELVAYLVGDETAAPAQWNSYFAEILPSYMIPSICVWLPAMPITSNGKVDRRELPNPLAIPESGSESRSSPVEDKVIGAWRTVLGQGRVELDSNFFAIGGHSLKAVTLVDLLCSDYQLEISVSDVFNFPTPRLQAQKCIATEININKAGDTSSEGAVGSKNDEEELVDFLDGEELDDIEAILSGLSASKEE